MCALLSEVWCCCVYDIEKTHNAHNCAVTIIALRCKMFEKVFFARRIFSEHAAPPIQPNPGLASTRQKKQGKEIDFSSP